MKRPLETFGIIDPDGSTRTISVAPREAWALRGLVDAGDAGATSITTPAPRWSSYVHKLRQAGVEIETVMEEHGGLFRGQHARYRLKSRIVDTRRPAAAGKRLADRLRRMVWR